jgi:hypothetical protein
MKGQCVHFDCPVSRARTRRVNCYRRTRLINRTPPKKNAAMARFVALTLLVCTLMIGAVAADESNSTDADSGSWSEEVAPHHRARAHLDALTCAAASSRPRRNFVARPQPPPARRPQQPIEPLDPPPALPDAPSVRAQRRHRRRVHPLFPRRIPELFQLRDDDPDGGEDHQHGLLQQDLHGGIRPQAGARFCVCVSLSCSDTQTPDTSARANRSSP